ncbi:MAG: PucR family transcriptional regulator, partial [Clostridia bacterium]|nr:PucR family transcriptional regulator [Clostridia bacterium]
MSNRLFQSVIHQMKDAVDRTFGVVDESFTIIACSELGKIGEKLEPVAFSSEVFTSQNYTLKLLSGNQGTSYIVFVDGTDILASKYTSVLAVAFSNIKFYYDEKYDRASFIKNIILDNILPGDIYIKARELYFNSEVSRTVILIRATESHDVSVFDVIQNLFPDKTKDFVININETDIALVKETKPDIASKTIEKLASTIA